MSTALSHDCVVYRCGKQDNMYLYLRAGMKVEELPEALRKMTGKLLQVMELKLDASRKLARVEVTKVMQQLDSTGYYLQMPPDGHTKGHLYFGD